MCNVPSALKLVEVEEGAKWRLFNVGDSYSAEVFSRWTPPPPVKADWWQLEYKGAALETIASSNLTALPKTQGGLSHSFGNPKLQCFFYP